jgi:hypothetical protein
MVIVAVPRHKNKNLETETENLFSYFGLLFARAR